MGSKRTPFYAQHFQAHGKIVDFSGWALPLEYKSMLREAEAVRSACGLFDASHMGELIVAGDNAQAFLQFFFSNDITKILAGSLQYNLILNEQAAVIDDCMVYNKGGEYMCVVNAANKEKVYSWLKSKLYEGVKLEDKSDSTALLALQGPESEGIITEALGHTLKDMNYMSFSQLQFEGQPLLVSRSGYSGEDGFEIYLSNKNAVLLWERLLEAGAGKITLCGLGARDILRIEAGYPLYGHEIDESTNPYMAGLSWAVKTNKDCIAKDILIACQNKDSAVKRVGFIMRERAVPRQGYRIYREQALLGEVTSGTFSPNSGNFIGMARLKSSALNNDDDIDIEIRNKRYKAKIVSLPFVQSKTKKILLKNNQR